MCYEGGCAVMTNEVPDIVVDLPTYEQVESVKDVVVNTGGMMVDTRGKKYKGLMVDWAEFKTVEGSGHSKTIVESFVTNFPEVASKFENPDVILSYRRERVYGDIYYLTDSMRNQKIILFIDMRTLQTVKAVNLELESRFQSFGGKLNSIYDSNYIYIRAIFDAEFRWVVFRKNTFEYVTTINFNPSGYGGQPHSYNLTMLFTEGFIHGHYFSAIDNSDRVYSHRINYNASGVPIDYSCRVVQVTNGVGGIPRLLWIGSDNYLYSGYPNGGGSFIINKLFVREDGAIIMPVAATYTNQVAANSSMCVLLEKFNIDGVPYLLAAMGNGTYVYWINETNMKIEQVLDSGYSGFAYDVDNKILATCPSATGGGGIDINGSYFDTLLYNHLSGNKWSSKKCYIPTIRTINTSTLTRLFELGHRSYFYEGELYIRFNYKDGCKVVPMDVLYGYKEVIQ